MRTLRSLGPISVLANPWAMRTTLVLLAIPQVGIGVWALISPRGWFENFPGAGNHWLPFFGPFDEHLVVDVGSAFLALGVLLVVAAVSLERRLVLIAASTYLAYQLPHAIYHFGADDRMTSGDQIANAIALAIALLAAGGIVIASRRPSPRPSTPAARVATGDGAGARIDPPATLLNRIGAAYARRRYGRELSPVGVYAHHPKLMVGYGAFENAVERSDRVPARLKALAEIKTAALVSCEWCMDFGSHIGLGSGVTEEQLRELPRYRESEAFSELEKLVLDYATAITRTPAGVSDELFARLREHFDDAQLVELTNAIAIENLRARFNHATGIAAQGFSEGAVCVVAEAPPEAAPRTPARA
jgi:AhpD family alkylhydroperoxidase